MKRNALNGLIGSTGEYYVAAELSARGWLATITNKNAIDVDILARHAESARQISVQVKTTTKVKQGFLLSKKNERVDLTDLEWFILVALGLPGTRPEFFVMPTNHVAAILHVGHRNYLRQKPGRADGSMRQLFATELGAYSEQWDWLLQPPSLIGYDCAPEWFGRYQDEIGLPSDHPLAGPPQSR